MKKLLRTLVIFLLAVCALSVYCKPEYQAARFVSRHGTAMEAYYHAGGDLPRGVSQRNVTAYNGEHPMLEVSLGAWGIVPSSTYFGCYYSPDGVPLGFQNTDTPLTPEGEDRWVWQGEGDNRGSTHKLAENWYFYKASF